MKKGNYIIDHSLNILFEQWLAVRELSEYNLATVYRNEDELSESYYTGLWHYKGFNKFLDRFQKEILDKLSKINPDLYAKLLAIDFDEIVEKKDDTEVKKKETEDETGLKKNGEEQAKDEVETEVKDNEISEENTDTELKNTETGTENTETNVSNISTDVENNETIV